MSDLTDVIGIGFFFVWLITTLMIAAPALVAAACVAHLAIGFWLGLGWRHR